MKIRNGFVSNSSSSSFIVTTDKYVLQSERKLSDEEVERLRIEDEEYEDNIRGMEYSEIDDYGEIDED